MGLGKSPGNSWMVLLRSACGSGKGSADISGHRIDGPEKWRYTRGGGRGGNPYEVEHLDLVNAIRAGNPPNEAEYGAHSSLTAIMGRLATYSGKEISWDQALNSPAVLAPDIANYTFDSTPPVLPDEKGNYAVAIPGKTDVFKPLVR